MRSRKRAAALRLVIAAMGSIVLLGACGSDQGSDTGGGAEEAYNEADVTFLQEMTVHHEQAIEMAEMVEDRTDRPELNELAGNIIESQSAEIDEIEGMLEAAGESSEEGGMDHGGMGVSMSEEDMKALEASEGEEFDKMFSEMMIEHHESAIAMSNEVLDNGESEQVADLARGIIEEQEKEVEDLKAWLEEWGL